MLHGARSPQRRPPTHCSGDWKSKQHDHVAAGMPCRDQKDNQPNGALQECHAEEEDGAAHQVLTNYSMHAAHSSSIQISI